MNRGKKLGKNVLLMTIGSIGSKVLTFLLVPLYTSCLSTSDYGVSDLIVTIISLLMPLFTLQISESLLRFALDKELDKKQVFNIGIKINCIGFIVLLIFSPIFIFIPLLKNYYFYFLGYYFSYSIYVALSNFTCGFGEIRLYTGIGVFQTVSLLGSNIILLTIFQRGIQGFLLSYIISYSLSSMGLFIFGKQYKLVILPSNIDKSIQKEMIRYSLPMIPNSISWWISNSSDKFIVTAICGASVMGIYSVAYKIPTILSVFYNVFMSAWRISSVDDFGSDTTREFYSKIYRIIESSLVMLASFIILFNRILSKIFFANEFFEARFFVPVLVIAFLIHGLGEFFGSIYTASKKTKMLFYSSLTGAIINIVLNIMLIPRLSGIGAALATLISYCVILGIRIVHTKTIMSFEIDFKKSVVSISILILMCLIQTFELTGARGYSTLLCIILLLVNLKEILEVVFHFLGRKKK